MKSFREKWEFPLSQLIEIITLWSPAGALGGAELEGVKFIHSLKKLKKKIT